MMNMRINLAVVVLAAFLVVEAQQSESGKPRNKCDEAPWMCTRECALYFVGKEIEAQSGLCEQPSADDYCFGQKVEHKYVSLANQSFPQHLEVAKAFPRCWNLIQPLICGLFYRPCDVAIYREPVTLHKKINRPLELWRILPQKLCLEAREACSFLGDLWPDFLTCDADHSEYPLLKVVDTHGLLFNSRCQMPHEVAKSVGHCMSPLVTTELNTSTRPFVDQCYIPCRSTFHHDGRLLSWSLFLVSLLAFGVLQASVVWLSKTSVRRNGFIYCARLTLLAAYLIYYGVWTLSTIPSERTLGRGACENDGSHWIRREMLKSSPVNLCSVQSWLLASSLFFSVEWLLIISFVCMRPGRRWDRPQKSGEKGGLAALLKHNIKFFLLLCLTVGFASVAATADLLLANRYPDGLTGVCFTATRPISHAVAFYAPLAAFAVLFGFMASRNYTVSTKNDLESRRADSRLAFRQPANTPQSSWPTTLTTLVVSSLFGMMLLQWALPLNGETEEMALTEVRDQLLRGEENIDIPTVSRIQLLLLVFRLLILPLLGSLPLVVSIWSARVRAALRIDELNFSNGGKFMTNASLNSVEMSTLPSDTTSGRQDSNLHALTDANPCPADDDGESDLCSSSAANNMLLKRVLQMRATDNVTLSDSSTTVAEPADRKRKRRPRSARPRSLNDPAPNANDCLINADTSPTVVGYPAAFPTDWQQVYQSTMDAFHLQHQYQYADFAQLVERRQRDGAVADADIRAYLLKWRAPADDATVANWRTAIEESYRHQFYCAPIQEEGEESDHPTTSKSNASAAPKKPNEIAVVDETEEEEDDATLKEEEDSDPNISDLEDSEEERLIKLQMYTQRAGHS